MRSVAALLLSVLAVAECERAAPEVFPQSSEGSSSTAARATGSPPAAIPAPTPSAAAPSPSATDDGARCIQPTPREAPAPVAAGPAPGCPVDPEGGPPKLPVVRVSFPEAGGATVEAELVRTERDSMRGLMYRKSLGADRGMLFDLHVRDDHKFWMHNTCIPLDLIYVDEDGLLVGIVENAPTLNDDSRGVGCPSRFVLEVNAGWARRHGVRAGQHVTLP
jgi:uncharacterized membrane protein (UPF0127 family)